MGLLDRLRVRMMGSGPVHVRAEGADTPKAATVVEEAPIMAVRPLLPDGPVSCVLDIGAHHGVSTLEILDAFPAAKVHAFEPDSHNHAAAAIRLAPHAGRVGLHRAALSDRDGTSVLHVNSHDGTHSLLEIGAQRYWTGWAGPLGKAEVPSVTLDCFCADASIGCVDFLKMDIQGAELVALHGAAGLLQRHAIRAVLLEVEFQPLYRSQPLIWEVGAFLASQGYGMYRLYEPYYHPRNPNLLAWADALFLAPEFLDVPEWEPVS